MLARTQAENFKTKLVEVVNQSVSKVKRGFEVFRQVCSNCHSLNLFKLEDLKALGYSRNQILYLARGKRVSARFSAPYESKAKARRFNNGVIPPDLSLVAKRENKHYVRNVLLGYLRGRFGDNSFYYNLGTKTGVTLMPPVLGHGLVKYSLRAPTSLFQYVLDVSAFLEWVAEPWTNLRMRLALPAVVVFVLVCWLMADLLSRSSLFEVLAKL
ncbi:cytochrome c1 [Candidatus Hodgkinia cicadicola]